MNDVSVDDMRTSVVGEICGFGAVEGDFDPVRAAAMCVLLPQRFL
jgi:hypothetical protein